MEVIMEPPGTMIAIREEQVSHAKNVPWNIGKRGVHIMALHLQPGRGMRPYIDLSRRYFLSLLLSLSPCANLSRKPAHFCRHRERKRKLPSSTFHPMITLEVQ